MPMNHPATRLLRDDHKTLRGLFRQLEAMENGRAQEMRPGVESEILMLLFVHSRLEEELFYPSLNDFFADQVLPEDIRAHLHESQDDHQIMKDLSRRLREQGDRGARKELFDELIQACESHLEREERELLPFVEKDSTQDPERWKTLGSHMERLKAELVNLPEFRQALPEHVQNPHGGEQKRKGSSSSAA